MTSDQDAKVVAEPQGQRVQEGKDSAHLMNGPISQTTSQTSSIPALSQSGRWYFTKMKAPSPSAHGMLPRISLSFLQPELLSAKRTTSYCFYRFTSVYTLVSPSLPWV
uniref:Uncharacterized protein n=1 Tax=Ovis aries TaxID=9940 RepID=A0AC11DRJ0_SHEEP